MLIGVLLLCHEVSAMQHSYLLDTHNVTFDCGIETLLIIMMLVIGDSERIIEGCPYKIHLPTPL